MLVPDVPVTAGDGDPQRLLQDLLGASTEAPVSRPPAPALAVVGGHRPHTVGLLHPGDDLRDVDSQSGEGLRLGLRQTRTTSRVPQLPAYRVPVLADAEGRQREGGATALPVEQGEQQVFGLDGLRPRLLGVSDRPLHDRAGVLRESLEHQCLPYFLCTACLLTPSSVAISCHDHPCRRALRTCTASSCSTSFRRAVTARSPIRGSRSPARVARSVASLIQST